MRPVLQSDEFPPPVFDDFMSPENEENEYEEEQIEMKYKRTNKNEV